MQVAVTGVEHVRDRETVLGGERVDAVSTSGSLVRGITPSCTK